jgi:hypothetical protein
MYNIEIFDSTPKRRGLPYVQENHSVSPLILMFKDQMLHDSESLNLKRHRYFPCHLWNFIVANDINIRSTVPLHVIAQADTPKTEKIIKNRFDDDIL